MRGRRQCVLYASKDPACNNAMQKPDAFDGVQTKDTVVESTSRHAASSAMVWVLAKPGRSTASLS